MFYNSIAYLLWFISGCGVLGFHRFYLGRIGTGLLWMFTGGLASIGAFFDLFYIPTMVREANISIKYRRALLKEYESRQITGSETQRPTIRKESLEKIILKTAKMNKGIATPGEVALEGDIPIQEAKNALEKLVLEGYAEMKIRKSGIIAYVFPDFQEDESDFEDI